MTGCAQIVESRTNLLFLLRKDALARRRQGPRRLAHALYALLHGAGPIEKKFDDWYEALRPWPTCARAYGD
jgi:hypothetical protein